MIKMYSEMGAFFIGKSFRVSVYGLLYIPLVE